MKAIRTETMNATYIAEGCFDLPARVYTDQTGNKIIETIWELSPDELALIAKTGQLLVCMIGGVPPICVEVNQQKAKGVEIECLTRRNAK